MDDHREIKFPSKIEVHDPQIDSLKNTVNHLSRWLQDNLNEIIRPLQVLVKLPDLLVNFQKKMVEQFNLMFVNQIEVEVVNRQANIKSNEKKIKIINNHIEKKEKQLKEAKERIEKRYEKLTEKLKSQHTQFLQNLDSHIYEITEKIYPDVIQNKFSFTSLPTQRYLVAHTVESLVARSSSISEGFRQAKEQLENFLMLRESAYEEINEISTDLLEEGYYELPFWFAEIEDKETGEKRVEIIFEWELTGEKINIKDEDYLKLIEYAKISYGDNKKKKAGKKILMKLAEKAKEEYNVPMENLTKFVEDCKNIYYGGKENDK